MAEEMSAEYRGWHINYSASGYTTAPMIGGWDFGEIDVDMYEIDADMEFTSSAVALRHAEAAIDRWWDDRDAEAAAAGGDLSHD